MQILLVEPAIIPNTMLPILLLKGKVIVEDILSTGHLALLPLGLIETTLGNKTNTLG
jgi:hypothetical protein